MLDQPAGRQQATQRPPPADHVEVDVGAVAGDDVAEVLGAPHREDGEVPQRVALAAFDQSRMPVTSSPSTKMWQTCRSPCMNTGVHGLSAVSASRRLRVHVGGKDLVGDEPLALAVEL